MKSNRQPKVKIVKIGTIGTIVNFSQKSQKKKKVHWLPNKTSQVPSTESKAPDERIKWTTVSVISGKRIMKGGTAEGRTSISNAADWDSMSTVCA